MMLGLHRSDYLNLAASVERGTQGSGGSRRWESRRQDAADTAATAAAREVLQV